ncbi:MAG: hypothetical protein KC656_10155 [Myxococcales bacterium]|nr:hypothetical protein [Myxococcales bacterium]MCB9669641.1 hypothetical protein [Alphaproteobacteria bacterium]MCB9672768.1 hypothetical protein [Alphaproteobacteria bacterium]
MTLDEILAFFDRIGLPYRTAEVTAGFLPGLMTDRGCLLVDAARLTHPGDALHEAGHIAVAPADQRASLTGDVFACGQDTGDEMAAIAWSWAALQAIGGAPEALFHADGYKGSSEAYIQAFTSGGGFGYPLLAWYGMTAMPGQPDGFPAMGRWMR